MENLKDLSFKVTQLPQNSDSPLLKLIPLLNHIENDLNDQDAEDIISSDYSAVARKSSVSSFVASNYGTPDEFGSSYKLSRTKTSATPERSTTFENSGPTPTRKLSLTPKSGSYTALLAPKLGENTKSETNLSIGGLLKRSNSNAGGLSKSNSKMNK